MGEGVPLEKYHGGGQVNLPEHISAIITISNAIKFGENVFKASLTSYPIRIISKFPSFGLLRFHLGKISEGIKNAIFAKMPKNARNRQILTDKTDIFLKINILFHNFFFQ